MNLYEINQELIDTWELCVDEETGEINDELFAQFEALKIERDEKIENIALWIKNLRAESAAIKEEAKNLTGRAKTAENKADRLEKYIGNALAGEKFNTSRVAISWRKSTSVECEDMSVVPFEYLRYKEPELDKVKVRDVLKTGGSVAGCYLQERQSMSIK